ncbi:MAG: hypothetical protein GC159_15020 [Phycisphaera sp.]|nr:hypothetical protein [Phycisphaera sp.]
MTLFGAAITMHASTLAALLIAGLDWLWPALALLTIALGVLIWAYRRAPGAHRTRTIAFYVKLTAILILVLCLLDPLWTGTSPRKGANIFVVLADNSEGMRTLDAGADTPRGDAMRALLTDEQHAAWLDKLSGDFQVRRYVFDSRLRRSDDFADLRFDGNATAIGAALRTVTERFSGRPLAGVILLTDGNATDLTGDSPAAALAALSGLPPVYPVVVGDAEPEKDIALSDVGVNQTSFEDAPVTLQAEAVVTGYKGRELLAQLVDESGAVVESRTIPVDEDRKTLALRYRIKPAKPGVSFYRVEVTEKTDLAPAEQLKQSPEATLANNARTVAIDRGRGPYRILYVSGRPNWEYKFLRRSIESDEQVALVGLIRIAKREPKFAFLGRNGESSNPLFRGFDGKDPEETADYDQPVLVRLGTRDDKELIDGFPKTPEQLFAYHAVIIDDLEASFFTTDQQAMLERYVAERGGGLLMLGGAESMQFGGYDRTPIAQALPVYLNRTTDLDGPSAESSRYSLTLTREGWLQPWARLRDTEGAERTRLAGVPAFRSVNRLAAIKPGATAIATVTGPDSVQYPALVVQRFGHGRSAAMTIADLWHWGFADPDQQEDMAKAWRQTLRWLIADVPSRVEIEAVEQRDETNQPVELRVRARTEAFEPIDNATVTVKVTGPDKKTVELVAELALNEPGLFTATYIPRTTGGYHADATVTDEKLKPIGDAETGWTTDLLADEFRSLGVNRPLLETLASQTGGEMVDAADLDSFVASLPEREAPVTETWTRPLWHLPLVLLIVVGCLVCEWSLRRLKGLP